MNLSTLRISGSALTAERTRLDVISQNLANVHTTRTASGQAYRRQLVVLEAIKGDQPDAGGVRVASVTPSNEPMPQIFSPGHPDANPQGYVEMPNVNVVDEMVDLITATRAYEANVAVVNATKTLVAHALEIGHA